MNRISALLQKLQDLAQETSPRTAIDADLMLDYTRVLYADLLELRRTLPAISPGLPQERQSTNPPDRQSPPPQQPIAPAATARRVPPRPTPPRPPRPVPPPVAPVLPPIPAFEEPTLAELSESLENSAASEPEEALQPLPPPVAPPPASAPRQTEKNGDLRRLIGINDRYRFIAGLFGNDIAAYERAIDSLNGLKSRAEASHWMRENLWIPEDAETEDVLEAFRAAVAEHFGGN